MLSYNYLATAKQFAQFLLRGAYLPKGKLTHIWLKLLELHFINSMNKNTVSGRKFRRAYRVVSIL